MQKILRASVSIAWLFCCAFIFTQSCLPAANAKSFAFTIRKFEDKRLESSASESEEEQIKALAARDLVILIDCSGSMATIDCPARQSRWQWCCEQTLGLANRGRDVFKSGVRVVAFATGQKVYKNVKSDGVSAIFRENPPLGCTNVALAIKRQFNDYLRRRARPEDSQTVKPLLIAVITDGCFEKSFKAVQSTLSEYRQRLISPSEVSIVFLQVGEDLPANYMVKGLSAEALNSGFDIVSSKTFSEFRKTGLTDALLEVVAAAPSQF